MSQVEQARQYALEHNISEHTAYYRLFIGKGNIRPKKGTTAQELRDNHIKVIENNLDPSGWAVLQNGRRRPIIATKTGKYKNGCKYHYYVAIQIDGKQKTKSLATLIWAGYLNRDVPAGYVVDHIDNDSFNNDIRNLQLLSIGANVKKDNLTTHNQHTDEKLLRNTSFDKK